MKRMLLLILAMVLFSPYPWHGGMALPARAMVLVTNSIDYDEGYGRALETSGIHPFRVDEKTFSQFREYPNILFIGGPDAPQTGDIIRTILSAGEVASLREKGEGRLIRKENVWVDGQTVFVIAGWDREATSEAAWRYIARVAESARESRTISSDGAILWMKDDLEAGFARAKVEDRLVLVYVWAPWCTWCQKMESEIFPASCVQEIVGERYVPVRLDYDIPANADFAHTYFLWGTPSFLIFNAEGEKVGTLDGYQDLARFCERLRKYASRGNTRAV